MQKVSAMLVSLVLMLSLLPSLAFAGSEEVTFTKQEITDINVLYEKAKNGETDYPVASASQDQEIKDENNGKTLSVKKSETTQHLKTKKQGDRITNQYATTVFMTAATTPHTTYGEKWDSSIGVKAYHTMYWQEEIINSINTVDMNRVTGSWLISDPYLSVSNQSVRVVQNGYKPDGWPVTQEVTRYDFSFDYTDIASWSPLIYGNSGLPAAVGVVQSCTVYDSSSSWSFTFNDHIPGA
jgi:hypothetical protein